MSTQLPSWESGLGLSSADPNEAMLQVRVHAAQRYVEQGGEMIRAGQSLFGERLVHLGDDSLFYRVRTCLDGYESYVAVQDVSFDLVEPTHYICATHTNAREAPVAQAKRTMLLGMMSPVHVTLTQSKFAFVEGAGWVPLNHVREIGDYESDHVTVARRFIGCPYDWGGRDGFGLDCSTVVQSSLAATNVNVPRTAGEQSKIIGKSVPVDTALEHLLCGDFVFWVAHTGIMLDPERILHANEHTGDASVEYLRDVMVRRRLEEPENKKEIVAIRRLPGYRASR